MPNVFEVRFEQIAQNATPGRFSVPKEVVDVLKVNSKSTLVVEVTSHKGSRSAVTKLKSGNEIYGDFEGHFDPNELICVRVTKIGK